MPRFLITDDPTPYPTLQRLWSQTHAESTARAYNRQAGPFTARAEIEYPSNPYGYWQVIAYDQDGHRAGIIVDTHARA